MSVANKVIGWMKNNLLTTRPHESAADGWENPFATGSGQIVSSANENWQARMARLGAIRTTYLSKLLATGGTNQNVTYVRPKKDGRLTYFTHVTVSADNVGEATIGYLIGEETHSFIQYVTPDSPLELKLDGAILVTKELVISFKPNNPNTTVYLGAIWAEVDV